MPDFLPDLSTLSPFFLVAGGFALIMLVWDTVEVGRNDAANLVNAVFGARLMTRRNAVWLAGLAVVIGASLSSDVVETARKGIFTPAEVSVPGMSQGAALITIYISVYLVDTVMLYGFSAFGMPVSTTASLVFELLGAASAIGGLSVINWDKSGKIIAAIIFSIVLTGFASFLLQRAVRAAIRDKEQSLPTMLLHGGWVGGGMAAGLCYFLIFKGMQKIPAIAALRQTIDDSIGQVAVIILLWGVFAILIHAMLIIFGKKAARALFPTLAVLGMIAMAFAFGQNDLANCASPGLAVFYILQHHEEGVAAATQVPIHWGLLFGCGLLLVVGMTTKNAQRVTRAAASTGSMGDHVELWAPRWCLRSASRLLRFRTRVPSLAPRLPLTRAGKTRHFDALRASVIMSVSASVIASASAYGLPVSTTYVTFAAVIATGIADRIFQRGDAELKLARSIWVIFSWFAGALLAAVMTAVVAFAIRTAEGFSLGSLAIFIIVAGNLTLRRFIKKRADALERRVEDEARERMDPDRYALEEA